MTDRNFTFRTITTICITVLYFPHNRTLFSIQHPCYFMENTVHFVPLICPRKVQYILVKALPRVCTENTARGGACLETNTALGFASCCICLETPPKCCIFRTHELKQCFNCYIAFLVLSGPIQPSQSSK